MEIAIALIVGVLVGHILTSRLRTVGVLKVVTADEDGPYLFLELSKNVDEVTRKKYVTFVVNKQLVNPQK